MEDTTTTVEIPIKAQKAGIGGWLALAGFSLCYSVLVRFGTLFAALESGAGFESFVSFANMAFVITVLYLFVRTSRHFVKVYIIGAILVIVLSCSFMGSELLTYGMDDYIESYFSVVLVQAIGFAIWSAYFLLSKRVKATFVN